MPAEGRRRSALDIALAVAVVAVLGVGAYLGWSVWTQRRAAESASPAGRAIADLAAGVRKEPNSAPLRIQLAQALSVAGRWDEAIEQYKAALEIDEGNLDALSGLGFAAMKTGDYATAEEYWRRLIDDLAGGSFAPVDRQLESAYYYLGLSLMEQERHREAIGYLKEALRIRRDVSDTHYALAVAYRETGSDVKYREELEITLMFDPNMPEANYDYGVVLREEGDLAGAAERFRVSADQAPYKEEPQAALDELGDPAERLAAAKRLAAEDPKAALVEARIAAALDAAEPEATRLVARLYEKLKKREEAAVSWERLITIVPGDPEATEALKRLGAQ